MSRALGVAERMRDEIHEYRPHRSSLLLYRHVSARKKTIVKRSKSYLSTCFSSLPQRIVDNLRYNHQFFVLKRLANELDVRWKAFDHLRVICTSLSAITSPVLSFIFRERAYREFYTAHLSEKPDLPSLAHADRG